MRSVSGISDFTNTLFLKLAFSPYSRSQIDVNGMRKIWLAESHYIVIFFLLVRYILFYELINGLVLGLVVS